MKKGTREIVLIALFAGITYLTGFISIPLGPVPVTLQTFAVLLTGLLLRPRAAMMAQTLDLLLKLLLSGLQLVIQPSFGFLLAFILVAGTVSAIVRKGNFQLRSLWLAVLIGTVLTYLIGIPYMAVILNGMQNLQLGFYDILELGMILFLPGDAVKAVLAVGLAQSILKVPRLYQQVR